MTINQFRSILYRTAKLAGHVQAGNKAARTGSLAPIAKRFCRVYAGNIASRLIGALFPR